MNKKLETIKNKVTKAANAVSKKLEPVVKNGIKFAHSVSVIWALAMVIRLFIMVVTTGAVLPAVFMVLMLGILVGLV